MADTTVELQNGFVRGSVEKHEDGFDYYSFKGIPYAEPPVGELRFKDPVPKKTWSGVIDCKNEIPRCLQHDFILGADSYEEDCLYLNVYSRSINEPNKRSPVILIVHAGINLLGTAGSLFYGPDYLIRHDLVLVAPNYRLAILGFLDLEDEIASGNQGMKDLVLTLEWIQKNIEKFGGDPDNVTVFGPAATGSVAHFLALSPLTKGLIHKVISGGAVAHNSYASVINPKSHAMKFCSILGKNLTDSKEILDFLKSLDVQSLHDGLKQIRASFDCFPFGPGTDKQSARPFMPFDRYEAADQGVHLPYLVGHSDQEGVVLLLSIPKEDIFKMANLDFEMLLSYNARQLLTRYNINEKQLRRLYWKGEDISYENLDTFVDFASEVHHMEGVHRFSRIQAEKSSAATYLFKFSYVAPYTTYDLLLKDVDPKYTRTCGHLELLVFLFRIRDLEKIGFPRLKKGTKCYRVMEQFTEMWANFAKYGRPTIDNSDLIPVHWKPIADGTVLRYLNIDEDITMQTTVNLDQKFLSAQNIKV